MGKLNYSSRKIDGVKAAQVAAKDLKKRITPGTGARTTSRDPTLEIDISYKNLTDAGFDEFIAALQECMSFRDAEHPDGAAKVTELHLRGNGLTVRSLEKLTAVIELSSGDLRELDLSNNCIDIADHDGDEAKLWLRFLRAFEGCFVLKKVDFGGNRLGLAGVEMLARAYMQSELEYFEGEVSDDGPGSTGDEVEDVVDGMAAGKMNGHKENDATGRGGRSKKSPSKGKAKQNGTTNPGASKAVSPADLKRFACIRGLRSVPFIILSNTTLTTGAAIHLASMILVHRSPDHLLPYLPSSKTPTIPNSPHTDTTRCNGLIWLPNDNLTELGHKMLDAAETLRAFTADIDPEEDQLHREGKLPRDLDGLNLVGLMEQRRQHAKLSVEFTRVAKRARIEAMRTEGVHGAEIWGAALRMVTMARTLLMDGSKRDVEEQSGSEGEHDAAASAAAAAAVVEEIAPGSEQVQDEETAPLNTVSSNARPSVMDSAMAHGQIVSAANHHVDNAPNNRKYVPFDYRTVEDEPLLPTYPITVTQTIYTQSGTENASFDLPSVKESYPSDDTSIVYPMASSNDYVPNGYGSHQDYEYAQSVPVPEYDRMPMYSDASILNEPAPARPGPFQPGAVAFEANFPVLGKLSEKELAAQQAKETLVTPSQPKRRQRQRKSQSNNNAQGQSTTAQRQSNGHSPQSQASPHDPGKSQTNGISPNDPGKTNGHQKKREVQNWFAELPLHLTRRIIAYTAGANGVLSQTQQEGTMRYALDWKSVAAELRAQGAEEHQQIWKLVDAVECFTYSSLS